MSEARQLALFNDDRLTQHTELRHAVHPFLDYLSSEGKSQNTVTSFRSDLNLVCEFLGEEIAVGKISTKNLEDFLQWLEYGRGVPCSRKSYARRVTTLKVFFKWLNESKVRRDDPAAALLQRSGPAPLQPVLSPFEIEHLLHVADGLRLAEKPDARPYLLLTLLLATGIKKSETVRLTLDDIENRYSEQPNIIVRYKRQNVFKERRLPVDSEWLDVLEAYLEQYEPKDGYIFDCTPRNLEYVLTDLAKLAGIETRVSFEILRWTSAVQDYRDGVDMEDLREKMGLSEISWRETSQKIVKLANLQIT